MAKKKTTKKKKSTNEKDKSSEIAGKMASVIIGEEKVTEQPLKDESKTVSENSQESKEVSETKENDLSKFRPEGAPEAEDCQGEFESERFHIYKIKHECVHKYKGKKKILIEK
jgi:hypothetical protein